MSGAGSEPSSDEAAPFVESEAKETMLPYDKGGVPVYIAVLWVGFIVVYVAATVILVLPDLRGWLAH